MDHPAIVIPHVIERFMVIPSCAFLENCKVYRSCYHDAISTYLSAWTPSPTKDSNTHGKYTGHSDACRKAVRSFHRTALIQIKLQYVAPVSQFLYHVRQLLLRYGRKAHKQCNYQYNRSHRLVLFLFISFCILLLLGSSLLYVLLMSKSCSTSKFFFNFISVGKYFISSGCKCFK